MFWRKKCECNCETLAMVQDMKRDWAISELKHELYRARNKTAWLEYKLTGKEDALIELNYEQFFKVD